MLPITEASSAGAWDGDEEDHVSADRPDLGKGLLGYRRSAVDQVISDRDTMLRHAEARVRAAEGRVAELQTELSSLREANVRMGEQMDQLRSELLARETEPPPAQAWAPEPPAQTPEQPAPALAPPPRDDVTSRFVTEELAGILSAAEESASRIVERARTSTERQIEESNRLWRDVQAEVSRFGVWRNQVEPAIRKAHAKVESVRELVDDVPDRIREALAPMADAIAAIEGDMAELTSALTPPLLLTPGSEGEEDEGDAWLSAPAEVEPGLESDPGGETEEHSTLPDDDAAPGPFGAQTG
jgi:phage shock protein A